MKRLACTGTVLLLVALNVGCVERRFVVTSDPPGALVYRNGVPIGTTPVDDSFVYYGKYQFTLVRDGYETLVAEEKIATPWYEYLGIDFFSENIYPFNISDVRRLHFTLQPAGKDRVDDVLEHAKALRLQGQGIGQPRAIGAPIVPAPTPAPPVPVVTPNSTGPAVRPGTTPAPGAIPTGADPLKGPA